MKIRRLSLALSFTAMRLLAACAGAAPPPAAPPRPPPAAPAAPPPATPSATPEAKAPETPKKEEPPPPPAKPNKEKIQGKFGFDFMGSDPGKKAEEDAKKKAGKDEKKLAEMMKKAQDEAGKEWIEMTADTYTSYVGDKAVYKAKYEVVKEEGNTITVKQVGKDEIAKKEMKDPMVLTLVDDNTISMKDPKKGVLQFKRK